MSSFNGAAPCGARKSGAWRLWCFSNGSRFNGAAPCGARKLHWQRRCWVITDPASTGPRLVGRGNRQKSLPLTITITRASTGPRLVGRGNRQIEGFHGAAPPSLQRGRALWGAEIGPGPGDDDERKKASTGPRLVGRGNLRTSRSPGVARSLQRGRALWGAEIREWKSGRPTPYCFNGAAPCGARKLAKLLAPKPLTW